MGKRIVFGIMIFQIVVIGVMDSKLQYELTYMAIFSLILGAGVLLSRCCTYSLKEFIARDNRKTVVFAAVISVIWALMLPVYPLWGSRYASSNIAAIYLPIFTKAFGEENASSLANIFGKMLQIDINVVLPCLILVAIFTASYFFLKTNLFSSEESQPKLSRFKYIKIYKITMPIVIISIVCVLSSLPGQQAPDYVTCLRDIANNAWKADQPIAYSLYLVGARFFLPSVLAPVLVQTGVWIYANHFAVDVIFRLTKSVSASRLYIVAVSVISTPFFYLSVPYKDIIFSSAFLGFSAALAQFIANKEHTRWHYVRMAIWGSLIVLFRYSVIVCVLISLGVLIAILLRQDRKKRRRIVAVALSIVGVYVGVNDVIGTVIIGAEPSYYTFTYSVPINILGAIAKYESENIAQEDIELMEQIMPLKEWGECYRPFTSDGLAKPWGQIGSNFPKFKELQFGSTALKLNLKFLLQFPKTYITALAKTSSLIWEISRPWYPDDSIYEADEAGMVYIRDPHMPSNYRFHTTGFTGFTKSWSNFTWDTPIIHALFWRGGWSFFVMLACLIKFIYAKKYKFIPIFITPVLFNVLLMISIPIQDARYILHSIMCSVFFTALALSKETDKMSSQDSQAVQ